jgi:hypothetical protein
VRRARAVARATLTRDGDAARGGDARDGARDAPAAMRANAGDARGVDKIENMTGKTLANAFIDHFAKFVSWRSDSSGATVSARARIYNREESVIPT